MKITTFNPLIVTKDAEKAIKLFEELGFEKRHTPVVDAGDRVVPRTRMADKNGFHVDISDVPSIPKDMTAIRMNVDDFDEAYELLTAHGFKNAADSVEPVHAKAQLMVSPSGFLIELIQHIKE